MRPNSKWTDDTLYHEDRDVRALVHGLTQFDGLVLVRAADLCIFASMLASIML